MISVENFYWILYHNLLQKVGLDCWYYYPFGTKQNLSRYGEFQPYQPKQTHHVLFHFDQEPIWTNDFGTLYDLLAPAWSNHHVRILANSEYSMIKKQVCQNRGMLDWYFFYHGFAALDWFRDSAYVSETAPIRKIFCSLNHLANHKRAYRMALTARLFERQIVTKGDISFHQDSVSCQAEIDDPSSPLSDSDKSLIARYLCDKAHLPMIKDNAYVNSTFSARFGHQEYRMLQESLVSVVNETVFYDRKLHLTEKIFKPIVSQRAFLLVAAPGNLAYLRRYGFKTFGHWIDESYDDEIDDDRRLDMIANELAKLCSRPWHEILEMHQDMQSVLIHNKQHFFGEFRRIIVGELVDNFDTCIRIWNNGRVDDRVRPRHPDLESVKQVLCR